MPSFGSLATKGFRKCQDSNRRAFFFDSAEVADISHARDINRRAATIMRSIATWTPEFSFCLTSS